jgi:hypothetical protein
MTGACRMAQDLAPAAPATAQVAFPTFSADVKHLI